MTRARVIDSGGRPAAAAHEVVLVSADASSRGDLARYLAGAGFDVREVDPAAELGAAGSLVWLADAGDEPDSTVIESWLAAAAERCAVIVTWRKAALRALVDRFAERLAVLAPPVFGYQLVDALRAQLAI